MLPGNILRLIHNKNYHNLAGIPRDTSNSFYAEFYFFYKKNYGEILHPFKILYWYMIYKDIMASQFLDLNFLFLQEKGVGKYYIKYSDQCSALNFM